MMNIIHKFKIKSVKTRCAKTIRRNYTHTYVSLIWRTTQSLETMQCSRPLRISPYGTCRSHQLPLYPLSELSDSLRATLKHWRLTEKLHIREIKLLLAINRNKRRQPLMYRSMCRSCGTAFYFPSVRPPYPIPSIDDPSSAILMKTGLPREVLRKVD